MPTDKKISELPIATSINASDISVLVDAGTDYQYTFTLLLQFLEANLAVGAKISFGTVLPQNIMGSNGDVFVNTSAGSFAQKLSGSWAVVYTLPAANGADGTLLYGAGVPGTSTGKNSDSYINTLTGIFYQKTAGAWSQVFSMATGPRGPQGIAGTNGANGADGNTILFGATDPSNSATGTNGNFYINTGTYKLFGPKMAGVWGTGISLVGAGLPGGGTARQVLAKADSTDFNTVWEDNSFANLSGMPGDNADMAAALNAKVDKITGFGLSSNDYTGAEKTKLASLTNHYQGKYSSLSALQTAIPAGSDGDYAIVVASPDDQEYIWDSDHTSWVVTENIPAGTFAALGGSPGDNASLSAALNTKENISNKDAVNGYAGLDSSGNLNKTTDHLPEGSSNLYFTAARVLTTILTGIGFSTATAVLATDTILQAIGKLQAQITALLKIPAGGSAGQALTKIDASDGNTQWTNVLASANNLSDLGDVNVALINLGLPTVYNVVRATTATTGDYVEIGKINDPKFQPNGWDMNDVFIKVIASSDAGGGSTSPGYAGIEFNLALNYWSNNGIWQNITQAKTVGLSTSPAKSLNLQAYFTNPGDGTGYIKLRLQNPSATTALSWNITVIVFRPFNATFTPTTATGNDVTSYTNNGMLSENYITGVFSYNGSQVAITDVVNTATDANYIITSANQLVKLPIITAARTVTLPSPSSYAGRIIRIWNQNTSSTFLWTYASTVKDATNSTITAITNTTIVMLQSDEASWIKIN